VPDKLEDLGLKDLKEFSTGLLETSDHPWSRAISGLKPDSRLTIAGSLFLWRKVLPASSVDSAAFVRRVTAPDNVLPRGYLAHVKKIAEETFEVGWDKGNYLKNVEGYTPSVNSVKESGRSKGGYRILRPDRFEFGSKCTSPDEEFEIDNVLKFMIAPCDGKDRAVTVMSSSAQVVGPLHKALYDHLTKKKWLLRGEASPCAFKDFLRKKDELFVSGDYESATDHLPLSVAEVFLKVAFSRSRLIPKPIQRAAFKLLRATIEVEGKFYKVTRQLMGSLLCFPLLCLQNYAAFRFVFPDSVPVKINGDDIVFRSSREDYKVWAKFVGDVGLRLSVGKTMVSHSHFSLNSTFFKARWYRKPRLVPVVRCTSLVKASDANSLNGSYRSFVRGFGSDTPLRKIMGAWFLENKRKIIQKSGRSVKCGLKIAATADEIKTSGLWYRELFYFNSVPNQSRKIGVREEAPLPEAPSSKFRWTAIPEGWRRTRVKAKTKVNEALEDEFFSQLVDDTWEIPPLVVNTKQAERDYWDELEVGGFEPDWNRYRLFKRPKKKIFSKILYRGRLYSKPFYNFFVPRGKFTWEKVKTVDPGDQGGEVKLIDGQFARMLYECDDGWHRPVNFFPPPEEDSFLIYQGW